MGLVDLKTDLKSLKYGRDRPGGGSSNQPYIVTPIPNGLTANGPDFLLRQGALKASLTDVSRLTQWFSDPLSVNGLLFTAKQNLLERQNPKMINTNRIYLPTNTINQAGALAIGTHFNKQGLDPLSPLSYFAGGADGYYYATRGIGEYPTFQTLSSGEIENRLTIAYTSKVVNQPLGSLAINPFGINGLNPNILTSYSGGPNAPLGLGVTNIRIQNPTIKLKDVYEDGEDRAKTIYNNPNTVSALRGQNFLSHKVPTWIYNPTQQGASFQYQVDSDDDRNYEPLFTNDYTVNVLNRNNTTIYNKPLGNTKVFINYISADPSKPGYLTPKRTTGGISPTNNYNVDQIMSVGATQAYTDVYKDKGLGEGTGFRLLDIEPKEIVERNSATKPIKYSELREGSKFNLHNTDEDYANSDPKVYLSPENVESANVNWVYSPTKQGVSSQYGSITNTNSTSLFGEGENALFGRDETNTGVKESNPQQVAQNINNNVLAYTYNNIANQGTSNTFDPANPTPQVLSRYKTTQLSYITDYRNIINQTNPNSDLPSTNYTTFNRETSYNTARTFYKRSVENNNSPVTTNPNDINPNALSVDKVNTFKVGSSSLDPNGKEGDYINNDLTKFFFEINDNDNKGNFFLFFRAYVNNLSDGFQADWQPYKYVGRGENFYRYNGFSRDMSLAFTVYAHSRAEMIPLYEKLNYLAGITAPDYSNGGYMRGNFTYITVGDYINSVPSIIKSINLKPSFEAGWDINREENGSPIKPESKEFVGQIPRMIEVDLSFIPLHNFTPQFKENFIRNISNSSPNSSNVGVGGESTTT